MASDDFSRNGTRRRDPTATRSAQAFRNGIIELAVNGAIDNDPDEAGGRFRQHSGI